MTGERVYVESACLARRGPEVDTWREGQQQKLEKVAGACNPSTEEAKTGGVLGMPSKQSPRASSKPKRDSTLRGEKKG